MQYKSLYKQFFTNKDHHNTYLSLFNSPSSLKFNISINDNQMFLIINEELLYNVEQIYNLNRQIEKNVYHNPNFPIIAAKWLIENTLTEEIRMSNEMEGVTSTRRQIKDLMFIEKPKHYKRFYGMVNKYKELTEINSFKLSSSKEIRNLYNKILLLDIENEDSLSVPDGELFRKDAVDVYKNGDIIHRGVMPEARIIELMDKALEILNDEHLSLLVRIAIFHYLFGYIHPFYDGNGRMSRFISSAYLCNGLDILSSLQLSICCKQFQTEYYECFKITNDVRNKGDITYFVIKFLEIFKSGLSTLNETIITKVAQYQHYSYIINNSLQNEKIKIILDVLLQVELFMDDYITISQLTYVCNISKPTLRNYLNDSFARRVIICDASKREKHYSLDLEALDMMNV